MRIDIYSRHDAYVGTIGPDELLSAVHTDELNGSDELAVQTTHPLHEGERLVWTDSRGDVHEHVCQDPKASRDGDSVVWSDTALCSVCELFGDFIEDRRPYGYDFARALDVCLAPTRWSRGTVDQPGTVSAGLTFYHVSPREALNEILACGGEMEVSYGTDGARITSRHIGIRAHRGASGGHRRFSYGKDLVGIERTEHWGAITACYGYGKGVETDAGGYGRKLTFGDINNGKNYVENSAALKLYGRPDGKGGMAHVFGTFEDPECEDAATLFAETKAYLDAHGEPGVTYSADVIDLVQFGRDWEGVAVGDDVQIVDTCFSPALRCEGRVTKLVTDELNGSMEVTVGNITETMADVWASQQKKVGELQRRSSSWDAASSAAAAYLQKVVDGLNAQFNINGNSYTSISFEQGLVFSSVPLDADGRSTTGKGQAMQLCSQGLRVADGCKADGSWNWRTFGTGAGFTADEIVTGALNAGIVSAGTIRDKKGANYWNLDESLLRLSSDSTTLDDEAIAIRKDTIKGVDVQYAQAPADQQMAPAAGWTTDAPAWREGYVVWQRTVTTMADGQKGYSTPVVISGRDGVDGTDGIDGRDGERGPAGKDGVSTYFHRAYAMSADGRQGFSTTYGSGKTYLGTYVDSTPTDSTEPSKYQWSLIKGADGETGAPGKNGADGKTYYLHIAYATSADGRQGFSTSYGTGKTYIGQCVDLSEPDPTDAAAYTWSKIKGETGRGVRGLVEQYYLSTSSTGLAGGSWSTAQPAWKQGSHIWTRTEITWTDGQVTYTDPVLAKAVNDANQSVADLDESLDQEGTFNRLTGNGRSKGLYFDNGDVYLNADYLRSGTVKADRIDTKGIMRVGPDESHIDITGTGISFSGSDGLSASIERDAYRMKNAVFYNEDGSPLKKMIYYDSSATSPMGEHFSFADYSLGVNDASVHVASNSYAMRLCFRISYYYEGRMQFLVFDREVELGTPDTDGSFRAVTVKLHENYMSATVKVGALSAGSRRLAVTVSVPPAWASMNAVFAKYGSMQLASVSLSYESVGTSASIKSSDGEACLTRSNFATEFRRDRSLFTGTVEIPFLFNNMNRDHLLRFENGVLVSYDTGTFEGFKVG